MRQTSSSNNGPDARAFTDLRRFAGLLKIGTKDLKRPFIRMSYDNWFEEQRLFEKNRTGWDIVLKPRQMGMTTVELARDLQFALTHWGTQTLVVIHESKLADNLFTQLRVMYEGLRDAGYAPATRFSNRRELFFEGINSAIRVVEAGSTPLAAKNKGRSGTIHRLHATEVAFWAQPQDTMTALLSCVPTGGEVVIESTANGAQGMFFNACKQAQRGEGKYQFHFYPWWGHAEYVADLPRGFDATPQDEWERDLISHGCSRNQLQWWREKAGDVNVGLDKALQEFPIDPQSCFRASGRSYFDQRQIDTIGRGVGDVVEEVDVRVDGQLLHEARLRIYRQPRKGKTYALGADVSEGVGRDRSAITVIDTEDGRPVATWSSDAIKPGEFGVLCAQVGRLYGGCLVAIERNKDGTAALYALEETARYPGDRIYTHDDHREGWPTNAATRPVMWSELRRYCLDTEEPTPCSEHHEEIQSLIINKKGKPEARGKEDADGAKDDLWTSWAIANQVRQAALDAASSRLGGRL